MTNENGNFLLFSTYIKDLSKYAVDSSHRIVPKHFVCLNLGDGILSKTYNVLDSYMEDTTALVQKTQYMPAYFQNTLEEGAAVAYSDNDSFSGNFWYLMSKICLENTYTNINDKIVYVGDVDTTSWEDGYFDTILNISSGARAEAYDFQAGVIPQGASGATPDNILSFLAMIGSSDEYQQGEYIQGWTDDATPISGNLKATTQPYVSINSNSSIFNYLFKLKDSNNVSSSFTFDTIVILYNITDGDGAVIEEDIPMGIYFTGTVDNTKILNPVTIYTSDPGAYGVGTSWSLRIASKFYVDPAGTAHVEDIELDSNALYDNISAQLTAVADLLKTVQKSFTETNRVNIDLKNTLIQFFNTQKVNVPYIVNGWWFVNGTSTGFPAYEPLPSNWFEKYEATDEETKAVFEQ